MFHVLRLPKKIKKKIIKRRTIVTVRLIQRKPKVKRVICHHQPLVLAL